MSTGIPNNMGLDHVGIVVPNAQQAADFFIEVFDAEFDWEVKRDPNPNAGERGWSEIFDVHRDSYMPHVIMLKCGNHALTQYIELFEWNSPDQLKPTGPAGWHRFSDVGNSYISFTVKDMKSVVKHLKEKVMPKWPGTRFIQDPPMNFPLRGEICTSTFFVSPWGMWIELTSWSESQKHAEVIKKQQIPLVNPYHGKSIFDLPAPSFFIDLDIVDHNAKLMGDRFAEKGVAWRIPAKAHKCPEFAKYIMGSGAVGVVLLTLQEAEEFAWAGVRDIYLANQVANDDELKRLTLLATQVDRLRVTVDSLEYIEELADAVQQWEILTPIEVLVELNINHNRCGTSVDNVAALAVAVKKIELESGALRFMGITAYEGHTPILAPDEKTKQTAISHAILAQAKTEIEKIGIDVMVVSAGGSCNYIDCLSLGIVNEVQAGGGVLGDLLYYHKANLKDHGHLMGAFVLSQIMSVPADQSRAVGNAGFKTIGWHPMGGLPEPRDRKDLRVVGLSAEHTRFEVLQPSQVIKRGDKVVLIPGYTDAMGFLHREIFASRKDHIEAVWKTV